MKDLQVYGTYRTFDHEPTIAEFEDAKKALVSEAANVLAHSDFIVKRSNDPLDKEQFTVGIKFGVYFDEV